MFRRNFKYFLADTILFNLAMGIIGTTTVIPDFVRQLTSSEILIGLSGSMFTVGYMLPQSSSPATSSAMRRKKWWFVGPNVPVRLVMLIFAGITVWLGAGRPSHPGGLLHLLRHRSRGDGLVGVPWAT